MAATRPRKNSPIGFVRPPRAPAKPGVVEGGLRHLHPPPPGFVRFRAVRHRDMGLIAELDDRIVPVDGYGTDQITERPTRVALTSEGGASPLALRIPLLLDRWREQRSVEPEIRMLERMLGLSTDRPERPLVIVEGQGIPHGYERAAHLRWRLSEPEWGDDIRYVNSRHRAFVTVSVLARLAITPETLAEPDEQVTVGKKGRAFFHTTARVNTLKEAARYVRVPWKTLRKLNPKLPKDPDKKLRPGTRIRID